MEQKLPKNQHYIPQFILKAFADESGCVFYHTILTGEERRKHIRFIFSREDLYKNQNNNPGDPYKIEKDLSRFEAEISPIYKRMRETKDGFDLTREELARFRLFLSLLVFRSIQMKKKYKKIGEIFKADKAIIDFWKQELSELTNCRSIEDIQSNQNISAATKRLFKYDINNFYMTILERRGQKDFVFSDAYPSSQTIELIKDGRPFPILYFFPISPSRIIILRYSFKGNPIPDSKYLINEKLLVGPKPASNNWDLYYPIKKIYQPEVEKINKLIIEQAKRGYILSKRNVNK